MATGSVYKSSDLVMDYCCDACKEKHIDESAESFCKTCTKLFCGKCINLHSQLYEKHVSFGRGDMNKWPISKKIEDFLQTCEIHEDEKLKMFCQDHSQLCCTNCVLLSHRQCKTVMLLTDLVKNTSTDLKQVLVTIQTTLAELRKLQDNQEASIQSVQSSYDEQLNKIQETRQKIIAALDLLEKKTLQEMKDTLTKLQASLKSDVDKCFTLGNELKQLRDAIQDISDKSKQELSFIASIKCKNIIQQFENYQKKNSSQLKFLITFQPNSEIMQYLSQLSGLGKIKHYAQTLTAVGNADQDDVKSETEHINLKVTGQDGSVVHFKIKRNTPLRNLMSAYCDRAGCKMVRARFRFDGNPINETDTPHGLDMEDGDSISVFIQLKGGRN